MTASSPGSTRPRSVLLAGGGSAGHVSPLLALAHCLRRRDPDVRITALGTQAGLESRLVPQRGYELRTVPKVAFPRRVSRQAVSMPARLVSAVTAADLAIRQSEADVVVGFGGYVSTPAYLAARARRIPIVVHEQNARPGMANALGARLTPFVGTTFTSTALPHARVVGMPLRQEISTLDRPALRGQACAEFGLDPERTTVLVTGGSLGARRLNLAFSGASGDLARAGLQVLHLTGRGKEVVVDPAAQGSYVVREYADRMDLAYAAADLVVARAGANTICELTAVGLPAVYVPLPIGNGEQRVNATDVVAAGGGILVDDELVDAAWVNSAVVPLAADSDRLTAMAQAAAKIGERSADERLADLVDEAFASSRGAAR